jgi:pyruvate dehydrogenase E2 component (dihydrolipoamide acetyltransferase)
MDQSEAEPESTETAHRLTRLQRAMVKSMATAVGTAALSQISREIDMSSVAADRAARPERRSINTYVLAAVAACLPDHPILNGRLEQRSVMVADRVNLGVAVAVDEGLVVPIVHGADQLGFDELDAAVAAAADKARNGKLTFDDIEGGTFTVSNLGMFGVDGGFAIPPQPQGAILLVGRVNDRFVPDEQSAPVLRPMCFFGLTFDHRFIDGATAARLLSDLDAALGDAARLRDNKGTTS